MDKFFRELRRRNVFRVAGVYAVVGWLLAQASTLLETALSLPAWFDAVVVSLLLIGLPIALILAWAFEITPEGVKLTVNVPEGESIASKTGRTLDYAIVGGLALVAILVIGDRLMPHKPTTISVTSAATQQETPEIYSASIAVLPFADMSPTGDQQYFSDGIAEEILNVLARLPELKVAGRTSSFKFKGVNEDLRVIGEELGVANILEGSVRKQGDRIRITVQLIKAADGFHLWSNTYDADLSDIFAVQDNISIAVADALSVALTGETQAGRSVDPRAYDLYLNARQLLAMRRPETVLQSATLFEAATILDPTFDAAFSGLGRALSLAPGYTLDANAEYYMPKARAAADHALTLNPRNGEAHSVRAFIALILDWDIDTAREETRLAVEAAPNDAEIVNFAGDLYRMSFDYENGLKWEKRAIELDPLLIANQADVGWFYLGFHEYENALAYFGEALKLDPKNNDAQQGYAQSQLGLGDIEGAKKTAEAFERNNPSSGIMLDTKAQVAFYDGRIDDVRATLEVMKARAAQGEQFHFSIAMYCAMLGDYEEAAVWLKQAIAMRSWYLVTDTTWPIPEDWPDDPAIQAVFEVPALQAYYNVARANLAAHPREGKN